MRTAVSVPRLAYSPAEVAEAVGVTRQHVHNLISRGQLRAVKVGRATRIPASEVAELLGVGRLDEGGERVA